MPALSRLLLATERTEHDAGAERVALALAGALQAPLQVVLPLASNPEYLAAEPELALQAEARTRAALDELQARGAAAGVQVDARIRPGEPLWQQIVAEATECRTELLITRRVGRRGLLARLLVGEMVSQAAAHARCPALMVPTAAEGLWRGRVLAVIAAGCGAGAVLRAALPMARAAGARLDVCVPAAEDAAARVQQVGALLDAEHAGAEVGAVQPASADAVAAAARVASDLLVLGLAPAQTAHGRLSAEVQALVGSAAGPVLLVGAADRR